MSTKDDKSADAQLASDVAEQSLEDPPQGNSAGQKSEENTSASSESNNVPASSSAAPIGQKDIPALLQQLSLAQQPPKKETKSQSDYKFWNTQPVPKFKEPNLLQTTDSSDPDALPEGPILPNKVCKASAKAEPEKLVDGFEWCLVDLEDKAELDELYDLLYNHYVEDAEGSFRFKYSVQFLSWALKPPGWRKEWHIGVRTKSPAQGKKGKLVAFIAGIPVTLKVGASSFDSTEINFLTIHRKLRGKRLAPVLIKEVTRRCYLNGIYQALYTAGSLLPTPVSTCRYYHRSIDWEHLYKTGFSHLPPGTTETRQRLKYKVDQKPQINGLRPMKPADVSGVRDLLTRYGERFPLRQQWSDKEIAHWLCSDASKDVVSTFVLEQKGKITDFISYYLLESTVLRSNNRQETIRAAYLFYYATETAFQSPNPADASDPTSPLATRLQALMHDALAFASQAKFHVFNALTLADNPLFLKEQKFEPGDGMLHYYLFNWRTAQVDGGIDEAGRMSRGKMGGVGVVML